MDVETCHRYKYIAIPITIDNIFLEWLCSFVFCLLHQPSIVTQPSSKVMQEFVSVLEPFEPFVGCRIIE